jgi:hypothetical protein
VPPTPVSNLLSLLQTHPFPYLLRYRPFLIPLSAAFNDVSAREVYASYVTFTELNLTKTKATLYCKIEGLSNTAISSSARAQLYKALASSLTATEVGSVSSTVKGYMPSSENSLTQLAVERAALTLGQGYPLRSWIHKLWSLSNNCSSSSSSSTTTATATKLESVGEEALLYLVIHMLVSEDNEVLKDLYYKQGLLSVSYKPAAKDSKSGKRSSNYDPLNVLQYNNRVYRTMQSHCVLKLHRHSDVLNITTTLRKDTQEYAAREIGRSVVNKLDDGQSFTGRCRVIANTAAKIFVEAKLTSYKDEPRVEEFLRKYPKLQTKCLAVTKAVVLQCKNRVYADAKLRGCEVLVDNYRGLLNSVSSVDELEGLEKEEVVMAVDPGLGSGFKYVFICSRKVSSEDDQIISGRGRFNELTQYHGTIYHLNKTNGVASFRNLVADVLKNHAVNASLFVPIGTGTGYHECKTFIASSLSAMGVKHTFIDTPEHGASAYSALTSDDDVKHLDVPVRGAVSIGRRRLDPMSEFLKIPVLNAGVGQYQHELTDANDTRLLKRQLEDVAREIVGCCGVDVNNVQPSLLMFIPGITKSVVEKIVKYREKNVIRRREELNEIPGIGKKTFEIINGYCRTNRRGLDETLVCSEDYGKAGSVLAKLGLETGGSAKKDKKKSSAGSFGESWMEDVTARVAALGNQLPAWEEGEEAVFKLLLEACSAQAQKGGSGGGIAVRGGAGAELPDEIKKDWKKLTGSERGVVGLVSNVTDFGSFVDLGCKRQGLVHVSKGKGPGVGQRAVVDIMGVDTERGRIELRWSDNDAGSGSGGGGGGGGGLGRKREASGEGSKGGGHHHATKKTKTF